VARILRDGGASAYLFDSVERNVTSRIPANAADQIPAFGSGSLGYEELTPKGTGSDPADNGLALLKVTLAGRDPRTNPHDGVRFDWWSWDALRRAEIKVQIAHGGTLDTAAQQPPARRLAVHSVAKPIQLPLLLEETA